MDLDLSDDEGEQEEKRNQTNLVTCTITQVSPESQHLS